MFDTYEFTGIELAIWATIIATLCVALYNLWRRNRMDYHAGYDSLTGLIHRREFEKRLKSSLDSSHKHGEHHALLYMDVDQFKVVNENFSHQAGDELLIQLSELLRVNVRGEDKLARLGGDEFSVLLENCPIEKAVAKARKFINVVEEYNFSWQEKTFDVSMGVGVVAIDSSSGSVNEILKSADSACVAAKAKGRNQVVIYQSDDPLLQKQRGEMKWATRISDALRDHEFQLYYQEILPIQKEESDVFHCELLMRTGNDTHGLISPMNFIPAAERYNLMGDIDRWVTITAIQSITALENNNPSEMANLYGINLSGQSLSDSLFFDYVSALFNVYDIKPENICFEVTESTAITNTESALHFMHEMQLKGCKFALDDFGTGISSFSYLKTFPFDFVKIDGSFIRNIMTNEVDREMVSSISRIAKVLGIKTIAEYVEDEKVISQLRELNIDYAQGYGISEPAPLSARLSKPLDNEILQVKKSN